MNILHKNGRQIKAGRIAAFAGNVLLLLLLIGGIKLSATAQSTPGNWIEPVKGIQVLPVFHASLEIKAAGKTVLVDPSFDAALISELQAPDLILITDIHGDHMDPKMLALIEEKFGAIPIIAPKAVQEKLPAEIKEHVQALANGKSTTWNSYKIEAVPMYNLPDASQMFHPKGRGNGYVLTVSGKRIYLSGDTEATPELRGLKNIDLAFVCMNLPYTMDVDQAASGVLAFQPKVVIPYHYRGAKGLSDLQRFKKLVDAAGKPVKVDLVNFYPSN
ncbi:L-ascorbate metabolism protein UlaG, beta-lactamase superfamily [Arachidicoccus rhizosphaerae]|uniref:L-ascorbate metabolism protein UlaG, beta-lactamase superfamily n=1 Tax=Arachidicoccus rhizosphaerae TaxID=551991 RepID=A0A1H3ZIS5_9BACT|nr:MBL fold metallo-hydrolase [Arachidicoccus rhizosphaerae]SEA23567.1 L-ascorbate metabolism protein UlaG, beta-lactamase superfamily [Arachidicoccus rhizosphaerae]